MTRVLVVDDEPQILRALGITLKARAYDVVVAVNGRQALSVAAQSSPDIVVLDPEATTTVRHADQLSKAGYTPFDGLQIPWRLRTVFLRGRKVFDNGKAGAVAQGSVVTASAPFAAMTGR